MLCLVHFNCAEVLLRLGVGDMGILFFKFQNFITILCHVGFIILQVNFPIIKTKPVKVAKYKKNGGYLGQSGRK